MDSQPQRCNSTLQGTKWFHLLYDGPVVGVFSPTENGGSGLTHVVEAGEDEGGERERDPAWKTELNPLKLSW